MERLHNITHLKRNRPQEIDTFHKICKEIKVKRVSKILIKNLYYSNLKFKVTGKNSDFE